MKFSLRIAAILLPACLGAQEVTVPDRPADHVLDQTGKVTAAERQAAKAALGPVVEKDGLGIYLVILNSAVEQPPADVAQRLAQGWRTTADTAVVLTAPELDPPLLVEAAGVALGSMKDEDWQTMKAAALAEGAKAAPGVPAMLAAAQSIAAQVRSYRQDGAVKSAAGGGISSAGEEGGVNVMAWVAGGALACSLLALLLLRRGRQKALIFPRTEFRRRFSAPHSGGNDAAVSFARRPE